MTLASLLVAMLAFAAADVWLGVHYRRYVRETTLLRASMSMVERRRTDALLAQDVNRVKVMVEMFRRQARVDPTLHLTVSLDSGVMYLERDGALLREMQVTVGPERRVGVAPDTLRIAAPRGKRSIERLLTDQDAWEAPRWLYAERGQDSLPHPPLAGALGAAAIVLDGGTVIYSTPTVGPLSDSTYILPGAIRVRPADLRAIVPNLRPGVAVYFY
jgi:hypothetical protein